MPENLYFIAVIIPPPISDEVTAFKNDIALNYNSSKALRVMPHITLKAPFKVPVLKHAGILHWFGSLHPNVTKFEVELDGFGCFDHARAPVIYVNPVITQSLVQLQKSVIANFEYAFPDIETHYLDHAFSPHITIAYRDLNYSEFKKAWAAYEHKEYKAAFTATLFSLLQHDGKHWNVVGNCYL